MSHNKQRAVIVFLAKGRNADQIYSAMHPVYGDNCFRMQQYKSGVKIS